MCGERLDRHCPIVERSHGFAGLDQARAFISARRPSVGDRVEISSDLGGRRGQIGLIVEDNGGHWPYDISIDGTLTDFYWSESMVRLAHEPPQPDHGATDSAEAAPLPMADAEKDRPNALRDAPFLRTADGSTQPRHDIPRHFSLSTPAASPPPDAFPGESEDGSAAENLSGFAVRKVAEANGAAAPRYSAVEHFSLATAREEGPEPAAAESAMAEGPPRPERGVHLAERSGTVSESPRRRPAVRVQEHGIHRPARPITSHDVEEMADLIRVSWEELRTMDPKRRSKKLMDSGLL